MNTSNDFYTRRDYAALRVAINWRIRRRLPRLTSYAISCGFIKDTL